ncbi:MAG TPA: DUF6702 family protein [Bacteroidia bacterium]|jgi:hypothetical protein|nr:DUF6702 family protein [Bacteroidia bacterium]
MIKKFRVIKIFGGAFLTWMLLSSFHPYYVSVTDIKYKADKTLQVSCKMFTDNIENTLKKIYKKPVDLLHPKEKVTEEKLLAHYITNHLKIKVNGKLQILNFIGYEKEEDAVWSYFEVKDVALPKTLQVEITLLYEYFSEQINMVHTEVSEKKQSYKVTNPEKEMSFSF